MRFGGTWIADSENVVLLFEPGRYPVAYFPKTDISPESLLSIEHTTLQVDHAPRQLLSISRGRGEASHR